MPGNYTTESASGRFYYFVVAKLINPVYAVSVARWSGALNKVNTVKKILLAALLPLMLAGCDNSADVVSRNLSTQAANFEVPRRIVFYNVRTGDYMLSIEGLCAREGDREIAITCQTGPGQYKKHFLGTTTEVTYFIEQTDPVPSDKYHYRVTFKPSVIVPTINLQ